MGYLHLNNLYKDRDILLFKECYALEKIHGTSTHIVWSPEEGIGFFSGGENYENFCKLFDKEFLENKFKEMFTEKVFIYGEAYGGKQQGMSNTYGKTLKFVCFDVKVGNNWLNVPYAEKVVKDLGLEFVDYVKINSNLEDINKERDKPSTQAFRNGCGNDKLREGVVLRPLIEVIKNNGERVISKHKRDEFRETRKKRVVSIDKLKVLEDAKLIAEEWVTNMRLNHILDKLGNPKEIERTSEVIKSMVEDIKREANEEIVISKEAISEIGKSTAKLYKKICSKIKNE